MKIKASEFRGWVTLDQIHGWLLSDHSIRIDAFATPEIPSPRTPQSQPQGGR